MPWAVVSISSRYTGRVHVNLPAGWALSHLIHCVNNIRERYLPLVIGDEGFANLHGFDLHPIELGQRLRDLPDTVSAAHAGDLQGQYFHDPPPWLGHSHRASPMLDQATPPSP